MEGHLPAINAQGSGETVNVPVSDRGEKRRFGSRFVSPCKLIKRLINYIRECYRRYSYKTFDEDYKMLRNDYNISHVLEQQTGENNNLSQFGNVKRFQATVRNPDNSWKTVLVYKDNKRSEVKEAIKVPNRCSLDIAYKELINNDRNDDEEKKTLEYCHEQEKKALKALNHPNIIKRAPLGGQEDLVEKMTIFEVSTFSGAEMNEIRSMNINYESKENIDCDFEVVGAVTTRASGIPLVLADSTLSSKIKCGLSAQEKHSLVSSMLNAVAYMHKEGFAHLDIKPDNILKKNGEWMLSDFAYAHHYSEMFEGSEDFMPVFVVSEGIFYLGTHDYMSPQIFARMMAPPDEIETEIEFVNVYRISSSDNAVYGTDARQADAYSLGLVLLEVFTGKNPTPKKGPSGYSASSLAGDFKKNVKDILNQNFRQLRGYRQLVKGLLKSDCKDRLTVAQAKNMLNAIPEPK